MRQFVAGAVIGSLVTLTGTLLWKHDTTIEPTRSVSPPSDGGSTAVVEAQAATFSLSDHGDSTSPECIVITESNMDEVASMLTRRIDERHERRLREEPKDPLWAPGMEQQIRMLISQHSLSTKFNLVSVDCHTVYCAIKAEVAPGPDVVDGINAFHAVVETATSNLGLHMGGSGSGSQLPDGMIEAHAMLRRYAIGDACPPGYPNCWNWR